MDKVQLERFQITGRLGAGADYDVRAALDLETGAEVALKRPVPQAVSRKQHGSIEARTGRLLEAYDRAGDAGGLLAPLLGFTDTAVHDDYFGDDLGEPYTVFVQQRALGIPLLGDMMSRIRGIPIAAGQNLFAMFPLVQAEAWQPFPVHNQLLELEMAFLDAGYILMDLRPQNVFFRPGDGTLQVIDSGALARLDDPAPRGRPAIDVNDACLELLKFYTTPDSPPQSAEGYRDARGIRPIVNVQQELAEMRRGLQGGDEQVASSGGTILDKIEGRSYTGYQEFRADLNEWLDIISRRNRNSQGYDTALSVWNEAVNWLRDDYWSSFKFEAATELSSISA